MAKERKKVLVKEAADMLEVTPGRIRQLIVQEREDGEGKELESELTGVQRFIFVDSIEGYKKRRKNAGRPAGTLLPVEDEEVAAKREYIRNYMQDYRGTSKKAKKEKQVRPITKPTGIKSTQKKKIKR